MKGAGLSEERGVVETSKEGRGFTIGGRRLPKRDGDFRKAGEDCRSEGGDRRNDTRDFRTPGGDSRTETGSRRTEGVLAGTAHSKLFPLPAVEESGGTAWSCGRSGAVTEPGAAAGGGRRLRAAPRYRTDPALALRSRFAP